MMIIIVAPVLFIYEDWHLSLTSKNIIMKNLIFKTLNNFSLGKSHCQIAVCAVKRKDDTVIATSD
jgi:hypothetical protein